MTDFKLKAIINVITDKANRNISDLKNNVSSLSTSTEASSQKQTQSWSRVGTAITAIGIAAKGMLNQMIAASPELALVLAEINFQFEEVFNTLGDKLAPIIEGVVLPAIETLTNAFLQLDPNLQTVIATTIALTAVLGPVAGGILLIGGSITAILGPIALVVAAIALLATTWSTNFGGIRDIFNSVWNAIGTKISEFTDKYGTDLQKIWEITSTIMNAIMIILNTVVGFVANIFGGTIVATFDFIMDQFGNMLQFLKDGLAFFIALFQGDFGIAGEKFANMMKDLLKMLVRGVDFILIDPLNVILDAIRALDIGGWKPFDWIPNIPRISDMIKFHQGGVVPGTGEIPILAMGGEEVLTKSDPRHRDNLGRASPININITIYGATGNSRDLRNSVRDGVKQGIRGIARYTEGGYSI